MGYELRSDVVEVVMIDWGLISIILKFVAAGLMAVAAWLMHKAEKAMRKGGRCEG